jgi:hypothetical protein
MLAATINPLHSHHRAMLALMPRLPAALALLLVDICLSFSRARRRRSARVNGGSDDGGNELLLELRPI